VDIVIYNNPECGMSRNPMAIIKAAGCNYSSRPSGPKKGVRLGKTAGQYQDDHDALTLSDSLP
jgi:hypothetical protein